MRYAESFLVLICFLALVSCGEKSSSDTTYNNPVISGAFPDPSVIRVGDTYYAAGTSFNFAPCYPLYRSTDLVNWEQVGAVFPEPPEWTSVDFWAPELFYHDSTFFVYYTAKHKTDNVACIGVASAKNPEQGFTDHGPLIVWGEEAIDAYVFKDDDGQLYITWKAYGLTEGRPIEILASKLSQDGLHLVGEHFSLTDHSRGWQGGNDEGQCLVKHGDWYYLFYSDGGCCDNKCDYRVRVSRSKELRSGWEQYPEPILEGGSPWVCPGHGTLISAPGDRMFYLHHAYHEDDFEFIGRQGLLSEIAWNEETHWPFFVNGNTPPVKADAPPDHASLARDTVVDTYYADPELLTGREWDLHFPRPVSRYENGILELTGSHSGNNFLGFRPETGDYSLQAEIIPGDRKTGIGIYTNNDKMLVFSADREKLCISMIRDNEELLLSSSELIDNERIFLKIVVGTGRMVRFSWSENGDRWHPLQVMNESVYDASFLAVWGYSPRAGLIWKGNTTPAEYGDIKVLYHFRTS